VIWVHSNILQLAFIGRPHHLAEILAEDRVEPSTILSTEPIECRQTGYTLIDQLLTVAHVAVLQ
jgi:hypothetical protein